MAADNRGPGGRCGTRCKCTSDYKTRAHQGQPSNGLIVPVPLVMSTLHRNTGHPLSANWIGSSPTLINNHPRLNPSKTHSVTTQLNFKLSTQLSQLFKCVAVGPLLNNSSSVKIQVPCYAEGEDSLRQTIGSLAVLNNHVCGKKNRQRTFAPLLCKKKKFSTLMELYIEFRTLSDLDNPWPSNFPELCFFCNDTNHALKSLLLGLPSSAFTMLCSFHLLGPATRNMVFLRPWLRNQSLQPQKIHQRHHLWSKYFVIL